MGELDRFRSAAAVAEQIYDNIDADRLYQRIWGGEDIHIGLYLYPGDDIAIASRRTVDAMLGLVPGVDANTRVIDLGAGYGGAARLLAHRYGCRVTALNLSEVQNQRNRALTREQGLSGLIDVVKGSFDAIPAPSGSYDVAWSQDAWLHAPDRARLLHEARRVLVHGGKLVFTDPMQRDDVAPAALRAVYARLGLESLGSFESYRRAAASAGFHEVRCIDLSEHLVEHYRRVRTQLLVRYDELVGDLSRDYVDRALEGLGHWVEAGRAGDLVWGILCFTAE